MRTDDLAAIPIKALMERNPGVDWAKVDDVLYGCANQAGEDNRNVARMAALLAGLPVDVPGATINRLCGSSMDAVGTAARAIRSRRGGPDDRRRRGEHVARALRPGQGRLGLLAHGEDRGHHHRLAVRQPADEGASYGIDSMPETAENVAAEFKVSRADQDAYAMRSQQRYAKAKAAGFFAAEIVPVTIPQKKGEPVVVKDDEHPRETSLEALAKLKGVVREDGTVTAGNASGVNDGSCALLLASRGGGEELWVEAQGAGAGDGHRGRAAAHHGVRPGAGHAQGPGERPV